MMTLEQYWLQKLSEECAEVAQMCSKTSQFGMDDTPPDMDETNRERLHKELDDVLSMVEHLNLYHGLDYDPTPRSLERRKKAQAMLEYSQSLGLVGRK